MKTNRELKAEFDKLNPVKQWQFIIKNKDKLKINLDNDQTFAIFLDEEDFESSDDMNILDFDNYIGNAQGVEDLLEAFGINAEGV